MEIVAGIIILIVLAVVASHIRRRKMLMEKYQDKQLVDRLMNHQFWQGQPIGQLLDSLGEPEDKDYKILKTKTREVWKYHSTGKNRYRLRITIEEDEVVGWEERSSN